MTTATRRLAAILAADVVGYSPLIGDHSVRLTSTPDGCGRRVCAKGKRSCARLQ